MIASLKRTFAVGSLVASFMLVGCASAPIDPADRDTTGAYDGAWIGEVAGPRASKVILPGNWQMTCEWEPFEILLVVEDGRAQLGKPENTSPVTTKGEFRIKVSAGEAGMSGGVMSGNSQFLLAFSGNLAGDSPRGKYSQSVSTLSGDGCSSKIRFRKEAG